MPGLCWSAQFVIPTRLFFFEPKAVYRAFREEVPDDEEIIPIGESKIVREGDDLTLITYGAMLQPSLEAAEFLSDEDGVEAEVFDLLTISPLDHEGFSKSVQKTGRAIIVNEALRSFGPAAEIASRLMEISFWYLEAPIERVTAYDVIVPMFAYEQAYLPDVNRIVNAARKALIA